MTTAEKNALAAAGVLVALYLLANSPAKDFIMSKLSRGYRNNNPGNLRDFNIPWNGLIASEAGYGSFCVFDTMTNGARAAAKDVKNDIAGRFRAPLKTIAALIAAYAPAADNNNVAAYVAAVSKAVGISPTAPLSWSDHRQPLMMAIFKHENGYLYDVDALRAGIEAA